MKNTNNWFKGIFILIIILGVYFYCSKYYLPHQKAITLAQSQENCSAQAQDYFQNNNYVDSDGFTFSYTNHFNSNLNKCFILTKTYGTGSSSNELSIDLYDTLEGKHYASYNGHVVCNQVALTLTGQPDECKLDRGDIWYRGDDTKTNSDLHVGYGGINGGVGNENTQQEFLNKIQPFMTE